jgi:hypothetical protein
MLKNKKNIYILNISCLKLFYYSIYIIIIIIIIIILIKLIEISNFMQKI